MSEAWSDLITPTLNKYFKEAMMATSDYSDAASYATYAGYAGGNRSGKSWSTAATAATLATTAFTWGEDGPAPKTTADSIVGDVIERLKRGEFS